MWGEVCRLKDKYLTILRVCISLSRPYYRAEVMSLREEQKQKTKGKNELPGSQMAYHSHLEISQFCTHRSQRCRQSHKTGQKHKNETRESVAHPSRGAAPGIESLFTICLCCRFCLVIITMSPHISGVAERFGDIWPDGESYCPNWRDCRGKAEDAPSKLMPLQLFYFIFSRWLTSTFYFPKVLLILYSHKVLLRV